MQADELSDEDFFRALQESGSRVLVIGRKALILLGSPVVTADFDVWLHIDDIEKLNAAFEPFGLVPNHQPAEARARGRYVLENGERVDVMIARARTGADGDVLTFERAWENKQTVSLGPTLIAHLPALADLITTKRWAGRAKDLVDIQFLEVLRRQQGES